MFVTSGTVTFERVMSPATLTIIAAGFEDNLTVGGATLNMGQTSPVNITVAGETFINSGGTINVNVGSLLNGTGFDLHVNGGGTLAISGGADAIVGKFADIGSTTSSVGTVTVTGVGSTFTANTSGSILVGAAGNGALTIQGGGQAFGANDNIGSAAVAMGTAIVTGTGSSWNSGGLLSVGNLGAGTLQIDSGATATSGGAVIANQATSTGAVTVTGTGSKWTMGGNLPVGNLGMGTLTIADGGLVNVGSGAGQVNVNALSTLNIGAGGLAGVLQAGSLVNNNILTFDHTNAATFTVPISGNGLILKANSAGDTTLANVAAFTGTVVAQAGLMTLQGTANAAGGYLANNNGTLRFSGGTVNLGSASIQADANSTVEYSGSTVRGGYLRGPGTHTISAAAGATTLNAVQTFNSTNIVQDGVASLLNFTNGGTITSNAALSFNAGSNAESGVINVNATLNLYDVRNSGMVTVNNGGAIDNQQGNLVNGGGSRTTIAAGGAVNLLGGTTMELNGSLLVNNGAVTGTVNVNYGSLAKGTGSYDVVNVNEGGAYSPGNSPGISTAASVDFQAGSFSSGAPRLVMELGGTAPGTQYDQLRVTGALTLNGTLDVQLVNLGAGLFSPHAGQSFDILDWGSLSGTFSTLQLPTLGSGLAWDTSGLYTTGVLSVASAGLPGDYNNNGVVDAADYVVWRKNLGNATSLPNDDTPGVGNDDYSRWRAHYGQTAGSGSGEAIGVVAVPEPASWMLALSAVVSVLVRCRAD